MLRGECLERVVSVERGTGQPDRFVAHTEEDKDIDLKISDAGVEHVLKGDHRIKLYTVKTLDGSRDFCPTETYTPTSEEAARHCPQGAASCPYYDNLKGKAMLIPGYWKNKTWNASASAYTISCISGVVARCLQWGYLPGAFHGQDLGKPLEKLFRACVHAARADYKGTGDSYTCPGTKIDMYDRWNIQRKEIAEYSFESLWDENGLVCLKRPRYPGCSGMSLASDCEDPSPGVGKDWNGTTGLLAVSSSSSNDLGGKCPTVKYACP